MNTTITSLTYNCDPESLADVTPEAFVDAFENELHVHPFLRDAAIRVTFNAGKSRLVSVAGCDLPDDPVEAHSALVERAAERAFNHCCGERV